MHIVNHCNLNCAGCNHFSPLAEPWFIEVEDFKNQIIALNQNIPVVREFIILGGEPTLHPQLLDICIIAREIMPKAKIRILSNGVNVDIIKKHQKKLKQLNIMFNFCSYPDSTQYEKIANIANTYNEQHELITYFNTRHISHQTLVDIQGRQDINQFYFCQDHQLPCLTLRDYKLFICPAIAHRHILEEKANIELPLIEGKDYLNISTIQNNMDIIQDFCFTPKPSCKFCHRNDNFWIWHPSHKDIEEFIIPLREMYFTDYNRYEDIILNNFDYFIKCFRPENPYQVDIKYGTYKTENLLNQLIGKIDIIIPHYKVFNNIAKSLLESLQSQTIINDCAIYFISDDSPNERELLSMIPYHELNAIPLKVNNHLGPGNARNYGFEHSQNKYVFFLDADDFLISPTALEELYNKAEEENADIVRFMMFAENESSNKYNYLLKREYLEQNNIKFKDLFFGEDLIFQAEIFAGNAKMYDYCNRQNIFGVYNRKNPNSISNTLTNYDTNHFNFFTSRLIASQICKDLEFYQNLVCGLHEMILGHRETFLQDFNKIYSYWILFKIYQLNPQEYIRMCSGDSRTFDYINNQFYVAISNQIITSEGQAIEYLLNYVKENYLYNDFTKGAAQELISILTL